MIVKFPRNTRVCERLKDHATSNALFISITYIFSLTSASYRYAISMQALATSRTQKNGSQGNERNSKLKRE